MSTALCLSPTSINRRAPGPRLPNHVSVDPRILEHLPLAQRMARRFSRWMAGQLDAEDLLSVAMVAMWEATPKFDPNQGATFGQFMQTVIWSALANEQKRVWRVGRRTAIAQISMHPHGEDELGIDIPCQLPSPLAQVCELEDAKAVRQAMRRLSPRQREVLKQLYFDEKDQAEVARATNRSRQSVQQRSAHALRCLERILRKGMKQR